MKRSTKMAPESLSTSYLIGSELAVISMITLKSSGRDLPEETSFRDIALSLRYGGKKSIIACARALRSAPGSKKFPPVRGVDASQLAAHEFDLGSFLGRAEFALQAAEAVVDQIGVDH